MKYGSGSYKFIIFGDQYTVRTDMPQETVGQAVALVDMTMKEIARSGTLDTKSIAVLAALRLAYQVNSSPISSGDYKAHDELCKFVDGELEKLGIKLN